MTGDDTCRNRNIAYTKWLSVFIYHPNPSVITRTGACSHLLGWMLVGGATIRKTTSTSLSLFITLHQEPGYRHENHIDS